MATPISINSIDKKKQSQSQNDSSNNNDNFRGYVLQRQTYYKFIRNRKNITISLRISLEEYEKLGFLMEKRKSNLSQVVREAIHIYYGLLSGGANAIAAGNIIIQSPIVNINHVGVEAKAESKSENNVSINIDLSDILAELDEIKKLIYNWYRLGKIPKAAFDTVSYKIKKIQKQLKVVN